MINIKFFGTEKAIKGIEKVEKNFLSQIEKTTKSVFFNVMLRDAKQNAQYKVLRRRKGKGTGNLARKIFAKVKTDKDVVKGSLNVDLKKVPYAAIHEEGGTIKPKKGQWLTIPFKGVKGKARDFKNTFFIRKSNTKAFIFQNLGKTKTGKQRRRGGGTFKPLFTLVKKVEIPKRPYLRPAILRNLIFLRSEIKKDLEDLQEE